MADLPLRYPKGPILRSVADLDEPAILTEEIHHLRGARVVVADYEVLQHDFPALGAESLVQHNPELRHARGSTRTSLIHDIIDEWLLVHAAFVSAAQVADSAVNRRLDVDGATTGHRPPTYGRGVVAALRETARVAPERRWRWEPSEGLLDLKGVGVAPGKVPTHDEHCSGVEYLGVALGDFLLKEVIDEIFRRANPRFATVPVYAVLDLGFDIMDGWRGTSAAGLHVRRAHRRPARGLVLPRSGSEEERTQFEMEMLLRSYGVTSTARATSLAIRHDEGRIEVTQGGNEALEVTDDVIVWLRALHLDHAEMWLGRVNIQLTRPHEDGFPAQLFDFGHINVKPRFLHPVCSAVGDRPLCLGGVICPDDVAYVQPDDMLCLGAEPWDRERLNDLAFDLAAMFRADTIGRDELRRRLEVPMEAVLEKWADHDAR